MYKAAICLWINCNISSIKSKQKHWISLVCTQYHDFSNLNVIISNAYDYQSIFCWLKERISGILACHNLGPSKFWQPSGFAVATSVLHMVKTWICSNILSEKLINQQKYKTRGTCRVYMLFLTLQLVFSFFFCPALGKMGVFFLKKYIFIHKHSTTLTKCESGIM